MRPEPAPPGRNMKFVVSFQPGGVCFRTELGSSVVDRLQCDVRWPAWRERYGRRSVAGALRRARGVRLKGGGPSATAGPRVAGGSNASGGIAPIGNGGSTDRKMAAPRSEAAAALLAGALQAGGRGSSGMPSGGSGGGSATGAQRAEAVARRTSSAHRRRRAPATSTRTASRSKPVPCCACLPPLQQWKDGEACANQDSMYDAQHQSAGAHAGFKANICAAGSAQDECPGWGSNNQIISGCLQQMFNEGPPPMMPCTGACFQAHGHFINMTSTRYTNVACGFFTHTDGKIWAVQNFK